MADEIVAPGVGRMVSEWDFTTRYYGEAAALVAAGLLEADRPLPGTEQGKRGVRWKDAQGRRHVLAKWRVGALCLTVYPTPDERKAKQLAWKNARRDEAIKAELAALCIEEDAWRQKMIDTASCGIFAMVWQAFRENAPGEPNARWAGPYTFNQQARDELAEHWTAIRDLLLRAPVRRDATRIEALKRERTALQDQSLQSFLARVAG